MTDSPELLKHFPKKLPKELFDSTSSVTQAAEEPALLSRQESEQLFLLVLRLYSFSAKETQHYKGILPSKVEGQSALQLTLRASDLTSGIILSISIQTGEPDPRKKVKFYLSTTPKYKIEKITIEHSFLDKFVKVEYECMIEFEELGEWNIYAGEDIWKEVKPEIFDLLEAALTQAESSMRVSE